MALNDLPMPGSGGLVPQAGELSQTELVPQKREGFGSFLAKKYGGSESAVPVDSAADQSFGGFLANKYGAPTEPAQTAKKAPKEQGDFGRGFKEAYQQVPQLARGLQAIAGATAEKLVGEGGLATAVKKSGVEGFQKAANEIAQNAKPSDSWNFAYDKAKQGDFGSLVDWLQHGLGYVGGQATQMLATAGVGSLVGKMAAGTAAKKIAEGMVAKESARIAGTEAGAGLAADQIKQLATKAVTDKFAKIGTNAALGGAAVGMEGGEIGGDLASKSVQEGRMLTGAELGKAFASTLAAGGLEFVGDRLGLDILMGKSPLLKPAGSMPGAAGKVARGATAGAGAAPIEAGTEFGQTLIEEYGKGNNPLSPETIHHAQDAAALGALGGAGMGTIGGLFSSPQAAQQKADEETKNTGVEHVVQPHPEQPDKFVVVPKARSATGVPLEMDPSGSLVPSQPASTQADFNISNKPGFALTAEDKVRERELAKQREDAYAANPIVTIAGKPATELSNNVLLYTANRGSQRAKAVAMAELDRRNTQGVDPAIANAPESTADAVDRIIATGKDKADEIRAQQQAASNPIGKQEVTPDNPTPEPVETLNAQLNALAAGNKPGMLLTPGEPMPHTLPPGVKAAAVPGRGTLLYRDDATLHAALNGQMGTALGYGTDEKPATATHVVTARDKNGTVIQDVATDGSKSVLQAAKDVAGSDGSVEVRPLSDSMTERGQNSAHVVLPDNTHLPAKWDVVDADSVSASLKQGVNQPRDRGRAASDIQVQGIANNPDYRRLSDSPVMDIGAPTLGHDGAIVGGNGRFEGISRAYDQGSAGHYLASLKADAAAKGIDPARIDGMRKPVLVRRITQPFDTRKLAVASNSGTGMQYSGLELAKIDAERMKNLADLEVTDSGDISLTGSNIQNLRHALSDYNAAELGAMVDKDGRLSQEGVRRIRNAMLYSAYGNSPTLERLVESTDNDLRNISGALVKAAGSAAKVRADIHAGALPAELDISGDLVSAVETLSKIRAQGMTVDEHLAQISMFGDETSDASKDIMRVLEANIRSQKKLADFIKSYYDAVSKLDLTSGDMFGAGVPKKPELLNNAKERITEKQPVSADLFARPARASDAESGQKPANNESASGSREKDHQVKTPPASPKAEAAPQQSATSPELPGLRPLVESLIKRRAAAKQGGKDLSNAIGRAKEVMEGKRTDATMENRWFRLQAKAFEKADIESASILRQIADVVNPAKAEPRPLAEPAAVKSPEKVAAVADSIEPAKPEIALESIEPKQKRQAIGQESRIQDFGAKIGGARKDKAVPLGKRSSKLSTDDRPAWMRKYHVMQIMETAGWINKPNVGKWQIMEESAGSPKGAVRAAFSKTFNTEQEALDALPLMVVSRRHRVYSYNKDGQTLWGVYRNVTDRKRALIEGGFATYEDAMKAIARNPVKYIEHKFDFPERPWLDRIVRVGETRRAGDVTTKMFQDTFGFRGGEFGNWNMGGDGQEALNHAYDAMLDFADLLGVPPKALSLDGELAIAFGARGHGGVNSAAAHYEPGRIVFNLTKIKGAGSLAHEWWHAVDHYFARNGGRKDSHSVVADGHATNSPARSDLIAAIKHVVNTITLTDRTNVTAVDQVKAAAAKRIKGLQDSFDSQVKDWRRDLTSSTYRRSKKVATEEQLKQWDALIAKLREGDLGESVHMAPSAQSRFSIGYTTGSNLRDASDIYKAVTGRALLKSDHESSGRRMYWNVKGIAENKAAMETKQDVSTTRKTATDFVLEARKIDSYRTGDYWSMPEELGARAFESFIFDKLVSQQKRSDYLVHAVENRFYAALEMKPYPEGAERQAINKAFDNLLATLQTKETDKGVALFSRSKKPDDFVKAPDGSVNFGEITAEVGQQIKRQAAPIRLSHGVQNADGTGYGLAHIEANHGKEIRNAGFDSVESFVSHVAKNFNEILHANGRQLLVAVKNGREDVMFVRLEPSEHGDYYRISTAFPAIRAYLERQTRKGMKVLWSGSEPALTVTGKQPAYAANPETSSSQDGPTARGQSDSNIADKGPKFNRERIAGVRKRLKAASDKAKQATSQGGLSVSEVQEAIALLQLPGFKQIKVAKTQSELPKSALDDLASADESAKSKSVDLGKVRGVYLPKTDEIWIVADQIKSRSEAMLVALHEAVHRGLSKTFGRKQLDSILRQIYATNKRVRDAADAMMKADKTMSKESSVEEVLADMAYNNQAHTLNGWQRLVNFIKAWLADHGINLKFTNEMVEVLVGGAAQAGMRDGGVFGNEQANAYEMAANNGGFDGVNHDIRFSRSGTAAAAPIRDRMDKIVDSLIYNFQDRFKPLRDIQKRAGAVPESQDASLAEERYSGMVRARTDDFHADMRDPLIKAIHDSKLRYEEVEEYLHALHAPSRNAHMREINPTQDELDQQTVALTAQRDKLAKDADVEEYVKTRRELRQAEADIEDGVADESLGRVLNAELAKLRKMATVKDYIETIDKLRALRNVKPFTGDNTALSGMSNDEAKSITEKAKKDGKEAALQRISAMVDAITTKTRETFVQAGLEKPETIAAWNAKYEHYVPLHRDEVGGTGNPAIGQGFNIRGRESKRATGSNREVTNILAHVVAQHEAAIIRAEKTKVDRALFEFAKAHPDPDLWTIDTADMTRVVDPTSGLVVERVDPMYKNRPNVLTLKIDGEEHTIAFNEQNQEAMRLAASMKNLSAQQLGEVTQIVGKFTRFLATMSTTANPVFIARNFLRDLQTSFVNLSDTELAGMKKQVFADLPNAIRGMWKMARGDKSSQWAKYAMEFRNAGGQTGWMEHYKDIGERADKLKQQLEAMGPGKWNLTKRQATAWWELIEDANGAVENGVRLAAYVNARKAEISEGKAASIAKNLTVNFNRHGAMGVELNMWYMFMNASIQGTARLIQAMSNKQVQRIVGGVVASGFLMDMLARSLAGDDDDDGENDYDQLPEHTKSMNFVFWAGDRPVTIPMPYGYNFFASVGRKISEVIFRENYSPVKSGTDLASVFFDAFSPVGQAGSMLQYAAPTVADPFIQWVENKNFAGIPLRREQHPFGVPKPEYQMGFKSTSAPAKSLAEFLNDQTGGNEVRPGFINMNPALFDFAVSSIAGGAGRTYLQAFSLPIKVAQDEDIKAREVPFANIFLSAKPEYQIEKKYFDNIKQVQLVQEELKNFRGDADKIRELREEHGNELALSGLAKYTNAVLSNIRKQEASIEKTDPPNKRELKQALEERKRAAMARFNNRYVEATR